MGDMGRAPELIGMPFQIGDKVRRIGNEIEVATVHYVSPVDDYAELTYPDGRPGFDSFRTNKSLWELYLIRQGTAT